MWEEKKEKKDSTIQSISPQFFIEAPQLQNGVKFTKTAEQYSFTIASVKETMLGKVEAVNINNNK